MTDTAKLKESIKKSGLKLKHIADELGITYAGLYLKISNSNCFTANEIQKLCSLLNIDSLEEKESIFFAHCDDK